MDNLEQKRCQNIKELNERGACHICGSTCRNSQGFAHFLEIEEKNKSCDGDTVSDMGHYNEHSMVPAPSLAPMRTCACFGTPPADPNYWPYSLRVCDKCIQDDKGIGRIRNCGICGIIACDENCGPELVECTDESFQCNNLGCIQCRKMSDFKDMFSFTSKHINQLTGQRRMTRVCHICLEQSTPWVPLDFSCKGLRCKKQLVPSDLAELKRSRAFGSSPLNLLPVGI